MAKWQISVIEFKQVEMGGVFSSNKWKCIVSQLESNEGKKIIFESEIFARSDVEEQMDRKHRLIAEMGAQGWEPMPVANTRSQNYDTLPYSEVHWYFKRNVDDIG